LNGERDRTESASVAKTRQLKEQPRYKEKTPKTGIISIHCEIWSSTLLYHKRRVEKSASNNFSSKKGVSSLADQSTPLS
jgi:hypothetical protein